MTSYAEGRKQHVSVSQDVILEALCETGGGELPDIAEHFDISVNSARRKLDGLVHQGKATKIPGGAGPGYSPAWYEASETARELHAEGES